MSEKLNLADLANILSQRANLTKSESEVFLKEFFGLISDTLSETEQVKIKDLGAFKLTRVQARESIDVNTGEKFEIPSHLKLSFLPATALKELVNKPFSHFETTLLNDGVSFADMNLSEEDDEETEETAASDAESEDKPTIAPEIPTIEETKKVEAEEILSDTEKIPEPEMVSEVDSSDKNLNDSHRKSSYVRKKPNIFVPILGAVAIAAVVLFFFVQIGRKPKKEKIDQPQASVVQTQPKIDIVADTVLNVSTPPAEAEKVILSAGKTLRSLALEKLGSREFWVYIYYKNKDRIKNPNVVPVGTELILPDTSEYDMDAADPAAVANAKFLGDQEFKRY